MTNNWLDKWNDRYSSSAYAYGEEPNLFLEDKLQKVEPQKILFAAEGEGRNAVYAASKGWEVAAFDISTEAYKKAIQLATKKEVTIEYQVGDLFELDFTTHQFDVIALIYAHFPAAIKSSYHKKLLSLLKPGGLVVFEAFSKNHIKLKEENPKVGGPSDIDDLFSIDEIEADFSTCSFLQLEEVVIDLNEGIYHQGQGSVIRFIAQKKKE
ncbi:class I SAM-dependent methyltransferase [Myroides odoratus]|uniref:class I SAM-dependent methyltransferase n=1 Tax=Myroides odoratus TaxID=256 RepID=UPI0039B11305